MKRVIAITAGVVVAAAGAWVGASWYTGKKIEADVVSGVARFNQQLESSGLSVKIEGYERGILTSRVRYALHFSPDISLPNRSGTDVALAFDARIEHGPFAPSALAAGHLLPMLGAVHTETINSDLGRLLFSSAQGAIPLTADVRVAYNGDASFDWHISRLGGAYHQDNIQFAGASGAGAYARGTGAVKMHGDFGAFSVKQKHDGSFCQTAFDGATFDTNNRTGKFGILIGDSTMKIKHASICGDGSTGGLLDNMVYRAQTNEDDTALSGEVGLDIGKIKVDDIDMGAAQFVFKFNRLDGVAVSELSKQFAERVRDDFAARQHENLDEDDNEDEYVKDTTAHDAAMIAAAKAHSASIARLYAGKPSFSIDPLSVLKTPNGEARLTFAVELTNPDDTAGASDGLMTLIKTADATLSVSRPVLQERIVRLLLKRELSEKAAHAVLETQLEPWLQKMEREKVIKRDGDKLLISLHYADQTLDLNGSKVPIEGIREYLERMF